MCLETVHKFTSLSSMINQIVRRKVTVVSLNFPFSPRPARLLDGSRSPPRVLPHSGSYAFVQFDQHTFWAIIEDAPWQRFVRDGSFLGGIKLELLRVLQTNNLSNIVYGTLQLYRCTTQSIAVPLVYYLTFLCSQLVARQVKREGLNIKGGLKVQKNWSIKNGPVKIEICTEN
jgi:hypothetical protein